MMTRTAQVYKNYKLSSEPNEYKLVLIERLFRQLNIES